MAVDKYKMPASMLAPAVDPEQVGFKDAMANDNPFDESLPRGE
jgi:hypothetical protein